MARGPLTPERKEAMQKARKKTQEERAAAREALAGNPQFTNYKMWKQVDPDLQEAVKKAITRAQRDEKRDRIRKLQSEIERIQSEL